MTYVVNGDIGFNPRTYIRYDHLPFPLLSYLTCFNPRTYIRYDPLSLASADNIPCFNPRTYIRYDEKAMFLLAFR